MSSPSSQDGSSGQGQGSPEAQPSAHPTTETRWSEVWENERRYPPMGYSSKLLPTDRPNFSNRSGKSARSMKKLKPQPGWQWGSEWFIDKSRPCDTDGWQYAVDFPLQFYKSYFVTASVRRRRWVRSQTREIEDATMPTVVVHDSEGANGTDQSDTDDSTGRERRGSLASLVSITSRRMMETPSRPRSQSERSFGPGSPITPGCFDISITSVGATPLQSDASFLMRAQKAGAWLTTLNHKLLCGFVKGRHLRFIADPAARDFQFVAVACNTNSKLCGIDGDGMALFEVGREGDRVVVETCYENQRWWQGLDNDGWSSALLKSDRPSWCSSPDDPNPKAREDYTLPSLRWTWTGEWRAETSIDTDSAGWQYAPAFRKEFHADAHFADSVRQRVWKRTRKVTEKDAIWTRVALPDDTQAASIALGTACAWVVTTTWQILFRIGMSPAAPEGLSWLPVATPKVSITYVGEGRVAVSPQDHVWLTAPDGFVYFRDGSGRRNPLGNKWRPVKGLRLKNIVLGNHSVWGVTPDSEIVYRQGVSDDNPMGRSWKTLDNPSTTLPIRSICASPVPQYLWCFDESGNGFAREGLSEAEPLGTGWGELSLAPGQLIGSGSASGCENPELYQLAPLGQGDWSAQLLKQLQSRDKDVLANQGNYNYEPFFDMKPTVCPTKTGKLQVKHNDSWKEYTCALDDKTKRWYCQEVRATSRRKRDKNANALDIELQDLTAVHGHLETEDQEQLPFQFGLSLSSGDVILVAAESRREKEEWVLSLLMAMSKAQQQARGRIEGLGSKPSSQAIWGIDTEGFPWFTEMATLEQTDQKILPWVRVIPFQRGNSWGRCFGRFKSISAGRAGAVWALGIDGRLHAYDPSAAPEYAWISVPPFRHKNATVAFSCMAVSVSTVWTVAAGQVVVRTGISATNLIGDRWVALGSSSALPFESVQVSSSLVTAVARGILVVRRGFGLDSPLGTHWTHHNGLLFLADWPESGIIKEGPGAKAKVKDVAGSASSLCALLDNGCFEYGEELDHGRFEWRDEEVYHLVQVSSECTGRLWGLNREQDLVGPSFEDDNSSSLVPLLSVNIHPPNQKLRFRGFSVGAAGGHHRVVSQDEVVLGNGQVVAKRSSSRAASQFLPKLKSREDAIQLFLSQKRRVHYTPFCEVPEIRSYVCAWTPDGYWYPARLVGARVAPKEAEVSNLYFFLARLQDQTHIWLDKSKVTLDKPPEPSLVFTGAHFLYRETSWDGGVRYASGVVQECDHEKQSYTILRSDGQSNTVDISLLRMPPSVAYV